MRRLRPRGNAHLSCDPLLAVCRGTVSPSEFRRLCTRGELVMKSALADDALDQLFREARTYSAWVNQPVSDEALHNLYDLLKWGPTSANGSPARFVFLRSRQAKERLRPSLSPGNVEKTMTAPVTVIVAYDLLFYDKLPKLW